MSQITGGYDNEVSQRQGLRLSMTTFNCAGGKPSTIRLMDSPTGNIEEIQQAFETMSNLEPSGNKCIEEALEFTVQDLKNTANDVRPKAVLLVTEGALIESPDLMTLESRKMRNNGALTFSLAIGTPTKEEDKDMQSQQLLAFAGSHERNLHVTDANALGSIIDILAGLTLTDFAVYFVNDGGQTASCLGENPDVIIRGESLRFLDLSEGSSKELYCEFRREEWPESRETEISKAERNEKGELICKLSGSLEGAKPWSTWNIDPKDFGTNTQLAQRTLVNLRLKDTVTNEVNYVGEELDLFLPISDICIEFMVSHVQCAGGTNSLAVQGETVANILKMDNVNIQCIFDDGLYEVQATILDDHDSRILCELAEESGLFQQIELVVTSPSENGGEPFRIRSDLELSDDEKFCAAVTTPETTCWREPVRALFFGTSISWITSANLIESVRCLFIDNDSGETQLLGNPIIDPHADTESAQQIDPFGDQIEVQNTLTCVLPGLFSELSSDASAQRSGTVALVVNPESNSSHKPFLIDLATPFESYHMLAIEEIDVKVFMGEEITENNCVVVTSEEQKCIGQEATFHLSGRSIEFIDTEEGPVVCDFYDSIQGVTASFPVSEAETSTPENRILYCTIPASTDSYEGINFDGFALVSNAVDAFHGNLEVLTEICLGAGSDKGDDTSDPDDDMNFDLCWGDIRPRVTIFGDSMPFIIPANPVCRFHQTDIIPNSDLLGPVNGTDVDSDIVKFGPYFDVPVIKLADDMVACSLPKSLTLTNPGEVLNLKVRLLLGVFEGSVQTRELFQSDLTMKTSSCVEGFLESDEEEMIPSLNKDMAQCWGIQNENPRRVLISGQSVADSKLHDVEINCHFSMRSVTSSGDDDILRVLEVGIVHHGNSSNFATCEIPMEFFNNESGDFEWNVKLNTAFASEIPEFGSYENLFDIEMKPDSHQEFILKEIVQGALTIKDNAECFNRRLVDTAVSHNSRLLSDGDVDPTVCWGSSTAAIAISGPSALVLSTLSSVDEVYCQIDSVEIEALYNSQTNEWECPLPESFALITESQDIDFSMFVTYQGQVDSVEIVQTSPFYLDLSLQEPCISVTNIPDHVCIGSAHHIHFSGSSILERIDASSGSQPDFMCIFTSRVNGQVLFTATPKWISSDLPESELSANEKEKLLLPEFSQGFYECTSGTWDLEANTNDHLYQELQFQYDGLIIRSVDLMGVSTAFCIVDSAKDDINDSKHSVCHRKDKQLRLVGETIDYLVGANAQLELACEFNNDEQSPIRVPAAFEASENGHSITCTGPGWQPNATHGQYDHVSLLVRHQTADESEGFIQVADASLINTQTLCLSTNSNRLSSWCPDIETTEEFYNNEDSEIKNELETDFVDLKLSGESIEVFTGLSNLKCELRYATSKSLGTPKHVSISSKLTLNTDSSDNTITSGHCQFSSFDLYSFSRKVTEMNQQILEETEELDIDTIPLEPVKLVVSFKQDDGTSKVGLILISSNVQDLPCGVFIQSSSRSNDWTIVGIVIGTLCILLCCCGAFVAAKRQREQDEENKNDEEQGSGSQRSGKDQVHMDIENGSFGKKQRDSSVSADSLCLPQGTQENLEIEDVDIESATGEEVEIEIDAHSLKDQNQNPNPLLNILVEGDVSGEPVPPGLLPVPAPHVYKLAPVVGFVNDSPRDTNKSSSMDSKENSFSSSFKSATASFSSSWKKSIQALTSSLRLAAPRKIRFGTDPFIDYCDFGDDVFELSLDPRKGLGISLGWTDDCKAVIDNFKKLNDGCSGALEKSGLLALRDQLLAVNGKDITSCSFSDIASILRESLQNESVCLRFVRSSIRGNIVCSSPMKIAVGSQVNVENIEETSSATVQEIEDGNYIVTCESSSNGLGIRFGMAAGIRPKIVVVELKDGPLKRSGRVAVGHELCRVNSETIAGRGLSETLSILQKAMNLLSIELEFHDDSISAEDSSSQFIMQ